MAIAFQHLVRKADGVTEIAGTGIRVCTLHALYEMGDAPERMADGYHLPLAAVLEALPPTLMRSRRPIGPIWLRNRA